MDAAQHDVALQCRVLQADDEVDEAAKAAGRLRLATAPVRVKYWDNMLALSSLGDLEREPVADLGCRDGILLTWLHETGFSNLHGCDLRRPHPPFRSLLYARDWKGAYDALRMYIRHRRRMHRSGVDATNLPSSFFAAVACMSVIEHGVRASAFFHEAMRILRPGGLLVLSTDYWPDAQSAPITRTFNDEADVVFDRAAAVALIDEGAKAGFRTATPNLDAKERVVEWNGRSYTFLFMTFVKPDA